MRSSETGHGRQAGDGIAAGSGRMAGDGIAAGSGRVAGDGIAAGSGRVAGDGIAAGSGRVAGKDGPKSGNCQIWGRCTFLAILALAPKGYSPNASVVG